MIADLQNWRKQVWLPLPYNTARLVHIEDYNASPRGYAPLPRRPLSGRLIVNVRCKECGDDVPIAAHGLTRVWAILIVYRVIYLILLLVVAGLWLHGLQASPAIWLWLLLGVVTLLAWWTGRLLRELPAYAGYGIVKRLTNRITYDKHDLAKPPKRGKHAARRS